MSYHASIGRALALQLGCALRGPCIVCDGCGATHGVQRPDWQPYQWFLAHRSPPKWRGVPGVQPGGIDRKDYCPACVKSGVSERRQP